MAVSRGDLDMETVQTRNAMSRLTSVGSDLTTGWSDASAVINNAAGQLGHGPLGQAFLSGYQQHATEVANATTACCRSINQLAGAGHLSVTGYETTDANLANNVGAVDRHSAS